VYEGSSQQSALAGTYCGIDIPAPITSKSGFYIVFKADFTANGLGFNLTYSLSDAPSEYPYGFDQLLTCPRDEPNEILVGRSKMVFWSASYVLQVVARKDHLFTANAHCRLSPKQLSFWKSLGPSVHTGPLWRDYQYPLVCLQKISVYGDIAVLLKGIPPILHQNPWSTASLCDSSSSINHEPNTIWVRKTSAKIFYSYFSYTQSHWFSKHHTGYASFYHATRYKWRPV